MQGTDYLNNHLRQSLALLKQAHAGQPPSNSLFAAIRADIAERVEMDEGYKARLNRRLDVLSQTTANILVIGAEGAGKSATLNALFGNSQTQESTPVEGTIIRQTLNNLTVFQAPLPGYGQNADAAQIELAALLGETDQSGEPLIDLVMVVLDASISNLDDAYLDICHTVLPMMGEKLQQRLMVLFSKADKVASSIRGSRVDEMMPLDAEIWLDCTAATLRYRLIHNTGVYTKPLAFSALGHESPTGRPYNLLKLLARMMAAMPEEKRLLLLNQPLSQGDNVWRDHDDRLLYLQSVENLCFDTLHIGAYDGDRFGGQLGAFLGRHGRALGDILSDRIRLQLGITV